MFAMTSSFVSSTFWRPVLTSGHLLAHFSAQLSTWRVLNELELNRTVIRPSIIFLFFCLFSTNCHPSVCCYPFLWTCLPLSLRSFFFFNTHEICLLPLRSLFITSDRHPPLPPPSRCLQSLICCLLLLSLHPSHWPSHLFIFSLALLTLPSTMIILISFLFNVFTYSHSVWHLPRQTTSFLDWSVYTPLMVFLPHTGAFSIHPWEMITALQFVYSMPLYLISQVSGSDRPAVSGWGSQRSW